MSSLLWVAVGAALLLAVALGRCRSQLKAPRVGVDPGILGLNLPAAKREFHQNGHVLVKQGYHEYKTENFLVQTPDMQRLIVAPKFLPELRMVPEAKLSHSASLVDRLLGHYNGMDTLIKSRQHSDVCRVQLTQKLSYFVPEMAEELRLAMAGFLKDCTAEKKMPIPTYAFAYTMVLSISSRSFVGLPTSRDPKWLKASAECQAEIWQVASVLRPYHPWLRPFLRPFLAPKGRLENIMKSAQNIIFPLIDERLEGDGKQLDLLQFLIATSKTIEKEGIVLRLLGLMTAALHASTMVTTHALYDMCAMPEYMEALRAEALSVLQEDGSWELSSLKKLRKLDSFLKESMRYNQADYLGFNRKVLSPIKLSNGTVLPKDLYINMAAEPLSRDPANYDHPDKFDGYRWFRRWEANGKLTTEEEFTGTEPGNLAWGHGRLTCPGRWYGSAMIKLIIAELLVNYDVAFPEGQTSRPPNVYCSEAIRPDMEQVICLRKRV